jgi:Immunity protein 50
VSVTERIENADALTSLYGQWPSFHDAKIHRIVLDRDGEGGPSLSADIHLFQMTSELLPPRPPEGHRYFVLKNHRLVTLCFNGIELVELVDFNGGNVISVMEVAEIDPVENEGRQFHVTVSTSYGCAFELRCSRIAVIDVRPFDPS